MDEHRPKRRRLRWWHWIAVAVLLLIALAAVFIVRARGQLQRRIDEYRARGEPTSFDEVQAQRQAMAPDSRAPALYAEAFAAWQAPSTQENDILPFFGGTPPLGSADPLDPNSMAVIESVLARNEKTLDLMLQAARQPPAPVPLQRSSTGDLLLTHLSPIRDLTRLALLDALVRIERNEPVLFLRDLDAVLHVADSLKYDDILISYLVRLAILRLTCSTLETAVNHESLWNDVVDEVADRFARMKSADHLRRAFRMERVFVLEFYRNPQIAGSTFPGMALLRNTGFGENNILELLDIHDAYEAALDLPPSQRVEAARAVEKDVDELSPIFYPLPRTLAPSLSRVFELGLAVEAQLELLQAAVAVERFRKAGGELPESLADLVPKYLDQIPADPFTGNPLLYTRTEPGYVLYSVGPDETDQQGRPQDPNDRKAPHDIPFRVSR